MGTLTDLDDNHLAYLRRLFSDPRTALAKSEQPEDALAYLDKIRWPNEVQCVRCSGRDLVEMDGPNFPARRRRRCRACRAQFSPTSGTPLASEKATAAQLLICCSLTTQYQGVALANKIGEATGLSAQAATRFALILQDYHDRTLDQSDERPVAAPKPINSEEPELTAAINLETTLTPPHAHESRPAPSGGSQPEDRSKVAVTARWASAIAILFILFSEGKTDRILERGWVHGGQVRILKTERDRGETYSEWALRHDREVKEGKKRLPPDIRKQQK